MTYSEIFSRYKDQNGTVFYNILKKIQLPKDKLSDLYEVYTVPYTMPWILLSYKVYKDINLYWVIQAANIENKSLNPMYAEVGTKLYIVKKAYINELLSELKESNI